LLTNALFSVLSLVTGQARADLIRKTRRPATVQQQFLRLLLRHNQQTELGQKLRLGTIKTVDEFRSQVPVLPYSAYEPYIDRIAQGEPNLLTPDPVVYLNLSSGSTGRQKLIPVTRRSRKIVAQANQAAVGFALSLAQQRQLPLGKMLLTTSANLIGYTSGGIGYGHISGGTLRASNMLYKQIFAQPFEALLLADSTARHYICLLFALRSQNLSAIAATFPIIALQLCDYLEHYAEKLIWNLEQETFPEHFNLEPELRVKLEQLWEPAPQRAAQLREILQSEGRLTPQSAWSDLAFLITARGGTSDFYLERFPAYFGNTPVFGGTYASTEATFGVHYDFNTDGTILAIASGFFEFVPIDQWQAEHPKTLLPEAVKVGEYYRILATTYSGLYRYDNGDIVEVVGFYERTPLITFRYRAGGTISATVEKTTEHHVTQVVQALQQDFGVLLEDFCMTLSERLVSAYYVLNIELAPAQTLDHPQAFLAEFDRRLQAANTSYALKRQSNDIPSPQLRILEPGSFNELRHRPIQEGGFNHQLKLPHISQDREFLADLPITQVYELE
jgi:GH3 auxin-responsive promoter